MSSEGRKDSHTIPPEGASSLLGLFDAPPGATTGDDPQRQQQQEQQEGQQQQPPTMTSNAETSENTAQKDATPTVKIFDSSEELPSSAGVAHDGSAAHLMGLFNKPGSDTQPATQYQSTNPNQDSFSNTYNDDSNNRKSLIHTRDEKPMSGASGLSSLFADPKKSTDSVNSNASPEKIIQTQKRLSGLFVPPPKPESIERQATDTCSNVTPTERSSLLQDFSSSTSVPYVQTSSSWSSTDATPKAVARKKVISTTPSALSAPSLSSTLASHSNVDGNRSHSMSMAAMPPIEESKYNIWWNPLSKIFKTICFECKQPTTYIGSFMFLLYHVVFCLAMAAAITRPHSTVSILGLMTKTASLGIIMGACVYWFSLGLEIPALYPTPDLFLAPFLANLALIVDKTLAEDATISDEANDTVFLATFAVLAGIGISISGSLLVLASVFKLANLGSYLPFPVICGFFSAVGVLTWTLAIAVDSNGKSIGAILSSGDTSLMLTTLIHHLPSVGIAVIMKWLGPKNPFYVVLVVLTSIGLSYVIMFVYGISLEQATENEWFWSYDDLVYVEKGPKLGFPQWAPPAPFGVLNEIKNGVVHWGAVWNGLSTAVALGFLYMVRCSVHAAALKKNIPNLTRTEYTDVISSPVVQSSIRPGIRSRTFSEGVDIEAVLQQPLATHMTTKSEKVAVVIRAKPTNLSLKDILIQYGYSQFVSAITGGFGIVPSVAASTTMYALGAERIAPQVGSVICICIFYLTDFQLVGYIPKPAFSAMLVLSFIDMINTWFFRSYFKIKDKMEWLVVPAIVVCAFVVGLLTAVFLGIALSTFIFVAAFFKSGVVKYVATGLNIHSTIERSFTHGEWLNNHGDLIQILVLQNYLFFGNASSVLAYIGSMFEDSDDETDPELLPPFPKFVVLDLTLVTGMDTSTVDVFSDIKNLCAARNCKVFMAGLSPNLRSVLSLGGVKPEAGDRSKRQLRFFANLDTALGKAEDILLESEFNEKSATQTRHQRLLSETTDNGFRTALRHIDEEHGNHFSMDLIGLQEHTTAVELEPGDTLYKDKAADLERGLYFIEYGILKVERDTGATATRGTWGSLDFRQQSLGNNGTLSGMQARSLGRLAIMAKLGSSESHTFRLARIGPGWIAGSLEAVTGIRRQGNHVAVTHCRLHHLPYSKIAEIENNDSNLVLSLYKLMSYLMAKRQEMTIGQLATMHSIMTSPAQTRPIGRKEFKLSRK